MLNTENINKLNNLLDQLGEVREELAKINNLKKNVMILIMKIFMKTFHL